MGGGAIRQRVQRLSALRAKARQLQCRCAPRWTNFSERMRETQARRKGRSLPPRLRQSPLRMTKLSLGSWYPRSENPDLGHPFLCPSLPSCVRAQLFFCLEFTRRGRHSRAPWAGPLCIRMPFRIRAYSQSHHWCGIYAASADRSAPDSLICSGRVSPHQSCAKARKKCCMGVYSSCFASSAMFLRLASSINAT